MKPQELQSELTKIIAEECSCKASWETHPQKIASHELDRIIERAEALFEAQFLAVFEAEIEARERIKAGLRDDS